MSWKSYNGPPFNSHEFHKLAEYSRFEHRRIMPYSTGLEPMVKLNVSYRTIHEKCIRTALIHVKIGSCKKCTLSFTCPVTCHTTLANWGITQWSPEQLSTDYQPARDSAPINMIHKLLDHCLERQENTIGPREVVLTRQPKWKTLGPPFNSRPLIAQEKKECMVPASNASKTITNNSSHFKVIPRNLMTFRDEEGRGQVTRVIKQLARSRPSFPSQNTDGSC